MKEGETGDCMFLLLSGRLFASVNSPGGEEVIVGEISSGESVGEMSLITGEARSATVQAARDSELVRISKEGFERVVRKHPDAVLEISRVIVKRLRKAITDSGAVTRLRAIALLPAGPDAPVTDFARKLCKELKKWGSSLHLDSQSLQQLPGEDALDRALDGKGHSESQLLRWLSNQEKVHRFIIYEGDPKPTDWTRRCIRQADRILLLARGDAPSDLNEVEKLATLRGEKSEIIKMELVILPARTSADSHRAEAWLAARRVVRHHQMDADWRQDVGRIGRFLAGRAIGLVLGGGGARGFAHIGVLKALTEARVPIDMIGGVSMGAIIAAQHALGWDPQTMLERNREELANKNLSREFTLPLVSLTSGKSFDGALNSFFGDAQIEDLKLNFFCLSCNLSTGRAVVHRKGPLSKAVRASNSAPIVLTPTLDRGSLLVDGGLLNNQPGDVMKELCGGPTMVVNVSPIRGLTVDASLPEMPSPWTILWSRLNPFREAIQVPSMPAMMMRTIMVSSQRKSREVEKAADFYLRPPIQQFRVDDYAKIDEIARAGYEYTCRMIEGWKKEKRL